MKTRRVWLHGVVGVAAWMAGLRTVWALGTRPVSPGLRRMRGDVRVNGEPAQEGRVILPGDVVRTGSGAEAVYVVGADAFLLRSNTEVHHVADGAVWVLRLIRGQMLSVFGEGAKRLETPSATIGIRGTGCYLEAEPTQTYFCLCYGRAELTPLQDAGQRIEVVTTYHDRPFWISSQPGEPVLRSAPVLNHRDSELISLEWLVGRRPPFMTTSYTPRY